MKFKKFVNWKMTSKIISLLVSVCILVLFVFYIFILPSIKENLFTEKKSSLKSMVYSIYGLIENYNNKVKAGEMTLQDAQNFIISFTRSLKLKDDEYYFIINTDYIMKSHVNDDLMNKNISGLKDRRGKDFFGIAAAESKQKGDAYIDYYWPKPGKTGDFPKISYFKLFKEWDWIIITGLYIDDIDKSIWELEKEILLVIFISILAAIFLGSFVARNLGKRIQELVKKFDETFEVKKDKALTEQLDEIGHLSVYINSVAESQKAMAVSIMGEVNDITNSSTGLLDNSEQSSAFAAELLNQLDLSIQTSDEILSNINTVASSAEEMASSIKEIAKSTSHSSKIAQDANDKAKLAGEVMSRLGVSSREIGDIIKTITSIASQTNLLALNATIEAARAGELGKGFAVVANEVKELAKESARATEDITSKIKVIQSESSGAISSIEEIISIINQINEISDTIASAVEEQTVTTSEINKNISEASHGANSITTTNGDLREATIEFTKMAEQVKVSADELKEKAHKLENQLRDNFKL